MTHVVYADDLVLMGDACELEVRVFDSMLKQFAQASGLYINPQKAGLWFSKSCSTQAMVRVQAMWSAKKVEGEERYLGVMIGQKGDLKRNGRMLIEKIRKKLTGWKSNMLSHAGRLIMIKAVLMSMPVYSISLEMLPKGVIKELNSLFAKFFWGKTNQDRYLSFISWQKICRPWELGGLGVKDLQSFGEALFLKVVWSLMADDSKLWVQICKAKYFPIVGFWKTRRTTCCSKMWGQVIKMRDVLANQVQWRIGNGKKCNALSQPWFVDWSVQGEARHLDRKLKVCELVDEQSGDWNMQELSRLFQPNQVQMIIGSGNKPILNSLDGDRLIWQNSKSGLYSVKEGYKELTRMQFGLQLHQHVDWNMIWKWKCLAPKIKLFLWRLLHRELPLAKNLHERMPQFSPTCQRCHVENEYEMHCMFLCPTSRQVWFTSPLAICVHTLPMDIVATVQQLMGVLEEEGLIIFANTLWEIWKERNKAVIEHSTFKPQAVLQRVKTAAEVNRERGQAVQRNSQRIVHQKYCYDGHAWQVLVDASWATPNKGGGAYVIYERGMVHSIGLHHFEAFDPFHAEAMTVREAMRYMFDQLSLPVSTKVELFSD